MNAQTLKVIIEKHYPLLVVLIASYLLTTSMGTYTNWDAKTEYEAAATILTRGFPYVPSGLMINQPPLCFYITAAVLQAAGASYLNGVAVVETFGLGCVAATYALGTVLYGRKTGLAAAAIFGFTPWHVFLSRIFLIDNQYLFLSLLFLTMGVLAVKRNSEKLVLAAGMVFGLSILTKLFAVFALVPMTLLVYFNHRNGGTFRLTKRNLLIFASPTLILQAVWYGIFANQNFNAVYFNTDFFHPNRVADPILTFVPITMVNSAGYFVFAAAALAVTAGLTYCRKIAVFLRLDIILFLSAAFVIGVNTLMAVGLHSNPAYISAVKYSYMSLPFLCIIAASMLDKSKLLLSPNDPQNKVKWAKWALVVGAAVLIFASLLESTLFNSTWAVFAAFGVDTVSYFPFFLNTDPMSKNTVLIMHFFALALAVLSMFLPFLFSHMNKSLKLLYAILKS